MPRPNVHTSGHSVQDPFALAWPFPGAESSGLWAAAWALGASVTGPARARTLALCADLRAEQTRFVAYLGTPAHTLAIKAGLAAAALPEWAQDCLSLLQAVPMFMRARLCVAAGLRCPRAACEGAHPFFILPSFLPFCACPPPSLLHPPQTRSGAWIPRPRPCRRGSCMTR